MTESEKISEEIEKAKNEYPYTCFPWYLKGLSKAEDIIRKHMNGGWIPVEERLPEVDEATEEIVEDDECPEYIVTIRGAQESTTLKYSPDGTWFDENGYVYDVIAWQPLPGTYRLEGSKHDGK